MTSTRDPACAPGDTSTVPGGQAPGAVGSVHVERRRSRTRLVLRGEVDVDLAPALDDAVAHARAAGDPVEVDASGVTFMDSTGVAFLARLAARAEPRLVLLRPTPVVQFLLDVTAVSTLIDVDPDADADVEVDADGDGTGTVPPDGAGPGTARRDGAGPA